MWFGIFLIIIMCLFFLLGISALLVIRKMEREVDEMEGFDYPIRIPEWAELLLFPYYLFLKPLKKEGDKNEKSVRKKGKCKASS